MKRYESKNSELKLLGMKIAYLKQNVKTQERHFSMSVNIAKCCFRMNFSWSEDCCDHAVSSCLFKRSLLERED